VKIQNQRKKIMKHAHKYTALTKKASGIQDLADAEGRDLTAAEEMELSGIFAEAKRLEAEMGSATARRGNPYDDIPLLDPGVNASASPPARIDDRDPRIMGRGDRLSDLYRPGLGGPLSFGKIIKGVVSGRWDGAEKEAKALLQTSPGSAGGVFLPAEVSSRIIDLARNLTACVAAGAGTIPVPHGSLTIPRLLRDPLAVWRAENQAITEDTLMQFDGVELTPKSVATIVRLSIELVEDSPADLLGNVVSGAMAKGLAQAIDYAALFGSGEGAQPRGLINVMGVPSIMANGEELTRDLVSQAAETVLNFNVTPTALILAPSAWGSLDREKATESGLYFGPGVPESYSSLKKLVTNQTMVTAFCGDFTNMLFGVRSSLVLETTRTETEAFSKMQVLMRIYSRLDVAILRETAFCFIDGLASSSES
jgi:HK97 family phage major capsid protein